jgi:hypothetical protein
MATSQNFQQEKINDIQSQNSPTNLLTSLIKDRQYILQNTTIFLLFHTLSLKHSLSLDMIQHSQI